MRLWNEIAYGIADFIGILMSIVAILFSPLVILFVLLEDKLGSKGQNDTFIRWN